MMTNLITSFLLIVPFLMMELLNRSGYDDKFPVMLFIILWILAFGSIASVRSLIKMFNKKKQPFAKLGLLILAVVAGGLWLSIVWDQMPCFLGIDNCD